MSGASDPVHLVDLVSPDGDLDLEELAATIARRPVVVGTLTDEELHLLGPDPEATPQPAIDAPRLGALAPDAQRAALDAAFALLLARGELVVDDDRPDEVLRLGPHALVVAMRAEADARATFTLERAGARATLAVFRLPGTGVLVEEVEDRGLHHLTLTAAAHAAGVVAATVGADRPGEGPTQRAPAGEDLDPPLGELFGAADTRLHAVLAVSAGGGRGLLRELTVVVGPHGTHVVRSHADDAGASEVVLQPVAPADLPPLLEAFLTVASAPGDVPLPPAAGR